MKFLAIMATLLLSSVFTFGQPEKALTNDSSVPIPKVNFDVNGNLIVKASATSSNTDFDFLIGKWKLKHRKLKSRLSNSNEWEEFETEVEDFRILEGTGNMDIGRAIIDGKPWEGRTIRLFDPKTRLWSLYWVTSSVGVMDPPVVGSFENGIGHFFGKDVFKGKPIIMLFRWDARDREHPIWSQAFSPDNGKTWEWNWFNVKEPITDGSPRKTAPTSVINYPLPSPGPVPIPFLPGIVSKGTADFGSAFSPDGRSFYFGRSENNRSHIYVTRHDGKGWTEPVSAQFTASEYADADPAFGPDGRLYFISTRPRDASDKLPDYDIWFVKPLPDGGWSEPEDLKGINSEGNEFYISFSRNGNLYFASSRPGGFGEEDIYVSRSIGNQYSAPENLGAGINSESSEYDPGISADEDLLVFASSGRKDSFGGADLYASKLTGDRKWTAAANLGKNYNSKTREYCPYFSPDSKYFFYSSEGDVKWADAQILKNHIDKLLK